jgi:hypothetical protein
MMLALLRNGGRALVPYALFSTTMLEKEAKVITTTRYKAVWFQDAEVPI